MPSARRETERGASGCRSVAPGQGEVDEAADVPAVRGVLDHHAAVLARVEGVEVQELLLHADPLLRVLRAADLDRGDLGGDGAGADAGGRRRSGGRRRPRCPGRRRGGSASAACGPASAWRWTSRRVITRFSIWAFRMRKDFLASGLRMMNSIARGLAAGFSPLDGDEIAQDRGRHGRRQSVGDPGDLAVFPVEPPEVQSVGRGSEAGRRGRIGHHSTKRVSTLEPSPTKSVWSTACTWKV